jgi:RNA polymerase sigma factor (sigma-70 family)
MKSSRSPAFVDESGHPLDERIQRVLEPLRPRLRRRFASALDDDTVITEILEEAGRRIAARGTLDVPIEDLPAYAWKTVRNVANSRLRRSPMRLILDTLASDASEAALEELQASVGTPNQIEAEIQMREISAELTPSERQLLASKQLGFSSREIAQRHNTSVANVDTMFYRVKQKIRQLRLTADRRTR